MSKRTFRIYFNLKAEIINEVKNLLKIELDSYFKNQTHVTEENQS